MCRDRCLHRDCLLYVSEIKGHVFFGTSVNRSMIQMCLFILLILAILHFKQHKYICLIIKIFDIGIVRHYPDRFLLLNYTEVVGVQIYYHICEQIIS